jgi:dUTP pyrophosphatase
MGVRLINSSDVDYQVKKGDRVAQLVLYPLVAVVPENVLFTDEVTETARGEKGFGSSGK